MIVFLWRAGLGIQEALALAEAVLDYRRGALLVRRGKGGRRREVGMDTWGWEEPQPWLDLRVELPVGALFCVLNGRTRGGQRSTAAARAELRRTAVAAGCPPTVRPISCGTPTPSKMAREGVPLVVIQRQLDHSKLGITSIYLQGIDNVEIIDTVHTRRAPMIPGQHIASALTDPGAAHRAKRKWRSWRPQRTTGEARHFGEMGLALRVAADGVVLLYSSNARQVSLSLFLSREPTEGPKG